MIFSYFLITVFPFIKLILIAHTINLLNIFIKSKFAVNNLSLNFLRILVLIVLVLVNCIEYCSELELSFINPEVIIFLLKSLGELKDIKPS